MSTPKFYRFFGEAASLAEENLKRTSLWPWAVNYFFSKK
jgi:hypothetical protein